VIQPQKPWHSITITFAGALAGRISDGQVLPEIHPTYGRSGAPGCLPPQAGGGEGDPDRSAVRFIATSAFMPGRSASGVGTHGI